jgi:hypothetical protein
MLKGLLKKQLQQLWLGPRPSNSAETLTYGQIPAWHASMNGADDHCTLLVKGPMPGAANHCDVLATARVASGM